MMIYTLRALNPACNLLMQCCKDELCEGLSICDISCCSVSNSAAGEGVGMGGSSCRVWLINRGTRAGGWKWVEFLS